MEKLEALIIGAGVIGSSVAMHLAKQGMTRIRVVDFDLEGSLSSSELNAGGVRATWVQPINIEMAKLTIEFFAQYRDQVGYRDCGYLWLHKPERFQAALAARELQLARGWPVEAWDTAELKRRVPFIDKTDDLAGALFAPKDGLINPNLLKNYFREQARSLGVVFEDRVWVRKVDLATQSFMPHRIQAEKFETAMSHETKLEVLSCSLSESRQKVEYSAERIINCAGAWAGKLAQIIGYTSPCHPVRRQISLFDCRGLDLTPYGMIVDTSGVYFHPEGTNGLAGFATTGEPQGINFHYDGEEFFQEYIWPQLYERSTYFERLKHVTGWAGLYDVSPDDCAIIGPVEMHHSSKNSQVYEAHSFSGHGIMHSYSAGLLLAEKIIKGSYQTLDAELLNGSRFKDGKLIRESLII